MYNFKEIEEKARNIISKKEIERAVKNEKSKKLFSFLEGPPTANAPPALHHLEVRVYKDIINKFRYMGGFDVPRKAGWDCHGLPVEVQIEKKLKLNSKKDILKYGKEKFIKECRESVFSYIKDWNKSTEKLGYWIDLENAYKTLTNEYIESVWWSLKQLYDKKLLYEDHKVVPFCPRCETPLSSHEVAQGYEKIKEDSVVVKFKLINRKEYLLVWTTTPWTLPSNLAIAINPNLDYIYVKDKETYIVAKELADKFFENVKIIKSIKGKELIGEKYEPLFDYFKNEDAFRIIKGDFVTINEGTGIVHMAPAFGEVDYDACKAEHLPFVQPIDETGKFTKEVPDYEGIFIKDSDKKIIEKLEREGKLFRILKYEHDYPFCWRCDSPLMYYAIKSWFVRVTKYKDKLIKLNEKINWVPEHIKEGRFGEWLKNVKDWALSRKKFWGTPLPVWRCVCKNEKIIGSIKEMKENSMVKFSEKEIDLHKPWIDNIRLKCNKCGKEMSRVPDVIDCWYDSGSASFAQFHYPFENKKEFEERFPYDFIAEAIDQTRGWFYTLHVLATILFDDVAYKNVICAGHIVDEKGEKMSKSKGNIINPDAVLDSVGVDATRLQFCVTDIGSQKKFGINMIKNGILPFLNVLWNSYQYYKQLDVNEKSEIKIEDKWILSRLNSLIEKSTKNLEEYYIEKALIPIMGFVMNDFSRIYIKIIRERKDENVKKVIGEILDKISRLLAPYAPNLPEIIYYEFGKGSVHLSNWPQAEKNKINQELEKEFEIIFEVIEKGLAERDKEKIGLKWPLGKAILTLPKDCKLSEEEKEIVMRQLNIKKIELNVGNEISVGLDSRTTAELEAEGYAREFARYVQDFRKKSGLNKKDAIELKISTEKDLMEMLEKHLGFLKERVNAKSIKFTEDKLKNSFEFEIKGKKVSLSFRNY